MKKVWLARDKGWWDEEDVYLYFKKPKKGQVDIVIDSKTAKRLFGVKLKPGECKEVTITVKPIASLGKKLK